MFAILTSQQFGCGYYDSAQFTPYSVLHSYINIPDTSGRDSLFQAEATRCKNILGRFHQLKDDISAYLTNCSLVQTHMKQSVQRMLI